MQWFLLNTMKDRIDTNINFADALNIWGTRPGSGLLQTLEDGVMLYHHPS